MGNHRHRWAKVPGRARSAVPQRVPDDFNQWGPRIGVAWNVRQGTHPTVVRASLGSLLRSHRGNIPANGRRGNLTHCIGSCVSPDGGLLGFPYLNPNSTPLAVNQICGTQFGCAAPTSGGGYVDPHFQNPRVSSFTGGIEQSLPYKLAVTGTFSYVHSTHLRTGGYDSEEAWQRNYILNGTGPQGRPSFGRYRPCSRPTKFLPPDAVRWLQSHTAGPDAAHFKQRDRQFQLTETTSRWS